MKHFLLIFCLFALFYMNNGSNDTLTKATSTNMLVLSNSSQTNQTDRNTTNYWFMIRSSLFNASSANFSSRHNSANFSSRHNLNKTNKLSNINLIKSVVYQIPLSILLTKNSTNMTSLNTNGTISFNSLINDLILNANVTNGLNVTKFNGTKMTNRNVSLLLLPILLKNTSFVNKSNVIQHLKDIVNNRLMMRRNDTIFNDTVYHFQIVSYEQSNSTENVRVNNKSINQNIYVLKLFNIQQLIKHAILKFYGSKLKDLNVGVAINNSTEKLIPLPCKFPLNVKVVLRTPQFRIKEQDFERALVKYSINDKKCLLLAHYVNDSLSVDSRVECLENEIKNRDSLLRLADLWIRLDSNNETDPIMEKLNFDTKIFTYQPAWIIGLIVIGCIIALFFLGCIFAVCYTRRPYRRSSKVYEIDSSKNGRKHIPQIPGVNPSTKASTVKSRDREFYY